MDPKIPKLYGTCKDCGRERIRVLPNGTLARHKARGQYGFCTGFLAVEGSTHAA